MRIKERSISINNYICSCALLFDNVQLLNIIIIALIKQGGDFNNGHDTLTEEQYADQGSQIFREFNSYIQRVSENKESIVSILNSKDYTDGQKKRVIDNYWKQYQGEKKMPSN